MTYRNLILASATVAALAAGCTTATTDKTSVASSTKTEPTSNATTSTPSTTSARPAASGAHGLGSMERYDANGDGIVTREEYDTVRLNQFRTADTNGDGWLSEAEYVAEYETRLKQQYQNENREPDQSYAANIKQAGVRFAVINRARDGKLTLQEYQAAAQQTFKNADTNGDGVISKEDRPRQAPARADANAPARVAQ